MLNSYKFEVVPWVYEHGMLGGKQQVFKLTVVVDGKELVREQAIHWDMPAHESPIRFFTQRMVQDLEMHLEEGRKNGN